MKPVFTNWLSMWNHSTETPVASMPTEPTSSTPSRLSASASQNSLREFRSR